MIVCARCKTENADGRIRCGKCGQNISKRGEYAQQQGPKVVVLGSVEDLKRARDAGDIDMSDEDPTALGWLDDSDVNKALPADEVKEPPRTRRVAAKDIDKISGLKDLRDLQKALLSSEEKTPAEVVARPTRPIERPIHRTPSPDEAPSAPPASPPPSSEDSPKRRTDTGRRSVVAAKAPAEPVAAWLVCELFPEPFPLSIGKKYLIGREPSASIMLPGSEISRKHAGISTSEGSFWVEDLKSMNGTYVNGHAILKRRLREGDVLDVGPFALHFSLAKPNAAPPPAGCDPASDTRAIRMLPGALGGVIEANGVGSVLKMVHATGRSGVLTLRAGRQVGRIFVIDGEIHHAQFGKTTGEQALASLIPAEAGLLHFTDERIKVKRTIEKSTAEILGV